MTERQSRMFPKFLLLIFFQESVKTVIRMNKQNLFSTPVVPNLSGSADRRGRQVERGWFRVCVTSTNAALCMRTLAHCLCSPVTNGPQSGSGSWTRGQGLLFYSLLAYKMMFIIYVLSYKRLKNKNLQFIEVISGNKINLKNQSLKTSAFLTQQFHVFRLNPKYILSYLTKRIIFKKIST